MLENSESMSISCFEDLKDESYDTELMQERFDKLVCEIKGKSVDESLSLIQDLSGSLPEEYICLAEAMTYYANGDLFTSINKLEKIYDSLNYDTKVNGK